MCSLPVVGCSRDLYRQESLCVVSGQEGGEGSSQSWEKGEHGLV